MIHLHVQGLYNNAMYDKQQIVIYFKFHGEMSCPLNFVFQCNYM